MPDIARLIDQLITTGGVDRIARNRAAQFGTRTRRLLGAEILPRIDQLQNSYTDDSVKYRTVVGNAGTRYSPVVLKKGVLTGTVKVELFDIDIGSELTSQDYDALNRYLQRNDSMEAVARVTNFLDTTVNMGLEELCEVYRWQAIESAQITRTGANNYREVIPLSNPAGHRANAAAAWTTDTNDPWDDILNRVQLLTDKGYTVGRIISSRNVVSIMGNNDKVRTRVGRVKASVANASLVTAGGRASLAEINAALSEDGIPPIEMYDLVYRKQDGTTSRFISSNVMIFLAATGRDVQLDLDNPDNVNELIPDTLGYYGVGIAAGQSGPGRVIKVKSVTEEKPPRIEAQAWETSGPVINEPEGIATISSIA